VRSHRLLDITAADGSSRRWLSLLLVLLRTASRTTACPSVEDEEEDDVGRYPAPVPPPFLEAPAGACRPLTCSLIMACRSRLNVTSSYLLTEPGVLRTLLKALRRAGVWMSGDGVIMRCSELWGVAAAATWLLPLVLVLFLGEVRGNGR